MLQESPTPEDCKHRVPGLASLGGCSHMGLKAKSWFPNVQLKKEANSHYAHCLCQVSRTFVAQTGMNLI